MPDIVIHGIAATAYLVLAWHFWNTRWRAAQAPRLALWESAALLLPLGFFEKGYADVAGWTTGVWLNVLYLALAGSVASFILFYWVVRRVGAGVAAMTSYFVPVLTLAMAILFLGDRPQLLQLVGGVVILAGVRLATLRLARDAQPIPEGSA